MLQHRDLCFLPYIAATYSQLITQLRHQQAINLLKNSDLKIIDIAAELGYPDPAHFIRAFKQWTGRSPKNFRTQTLNLS